MADAKQAKMAIGTKMVTPLGQFAFTFAHKPDTEGTFSKNKYKSSLLIEKERNEELKPLKIAILACARKEWGADTQYKTLEVPFLDGDEKDAAYDAEMKKTGQTDKIGRYKNFRGKFYFGATSKNAPGIVGPDKKPLPEGQDVQSGDYGYMNVTPHAYVRFPEIMENGKRVKHEVRGVSLWLNSMLKHRQGERFGSTSDPQKDFENTAVAPLPLDDEGSGSADSEDFDDTGSAKSAEVAAAQDDGIF